MTLTNSIILLVLILATACTMTSSTRGLADHDVIKAVDTLPTQQIKVGRFESRGLWTPTREKAPAILM